MIDRNKYLKNIKRVVVKIGSSSLTSPQGGLDMANMAKLEMEIKNLMGRDLEIILVNLC